MPFRIFQNASGAVRVRRVFRLPDRFGGDGDCRAAVASFCAGSRGDGQLSDQIPEGCLYRHRHRRGGCENDFCEERTDDRPEDERQLRRRHRSVHRPDGRSVECHTCGTQRDGRTFEADIPDSVALRSLLQDGHPEPDGKEYSRRGHRRVYLSRRGGADGGHLGSRARHSRARTVVRRTADLPAGPAESLRRIPAVA